MFLIAIAIYGSSSFVPQCLAKHISLVLLPYNHHTVTLHVILVIVRLTKCFTHIFRMTGNPSKPHLSGLPQLGIKGVDICAADS